MTQKRVLYTKLFNTFSEGRLISWVLPQLNILCRSLVNRTTLNDDSPVILPFTRYRHFMCSPTYWISSKQGDRYIKTFSTLSGVRRVFLISLQLDIFCTSAVKRYYA